MFKIEVATNGEETCTEVTLQAYTDLPCEKSVLHFTFDTENQYAAQLLVRFLREEIREKLEWIRINGLCLNWLRRPLPGIRT